MNFSKLYEDVNVRNIDLQKIYDEYNKDLFNNELPQIKIRLGNLKRIGGMVKATRKRVNGEPVIELQEMVISSFYNKKDEQAVRAIMLHEMIHVYVLFNQIDKDIGGMHGHFFMKKLKELQPKVDFEIPLVDNLNTTISDHVKAKPFDVVIFQAPNYYSISVIKNGMIEGETFHSGKNGMSTSSLDYLIDRYSWKVEHDGYIIYFMESNDKELLKYPSARQFGNMKYFKISEDDAKRIIENGRLIFKLDKETFDKWVKKDEI